MASYADRAARSTLGNTAEARVCSDATVSTEEMVGTEWPGVCLCVDISGAQRLADDLNIASERCGATVKPRPTLQAQLPLAVKKHESHRGPKSGDSLRADLWETLPYIRCRARAAFLVVRQGKEAQAEFQKILDHRGLVLNSPIGALARVAIARAYAVQGDTTAAKDAYQDFFTLWKDADPDIPVLIAAKSEYASLH